MARQGKQESKSLDAMTAAPRHHHVLLENDSDGKVLLDSRAIGTNPEPGAILWGGPLPPHAVRNVGGRALRMIAVEIKGTP